MAHADPATRRDRRRAAAGRSASAALALVLLMTLSSTAGAKPKHEEDQSDSVAEDQGDSTAQEDQDDSAEDSDADSSSSDGDSSSDADGSSDAGEASKTVEATAETEPVPHASDAADDPAIWVNPADPAASLVIGTDKDGGLGIYDLQGHELSYLAGGNPNNVDLRDGFPLGGEDVTLVAASDEAGGVLLYRLDSSGKSLDRIGSVPTAGLYGLCMYHGQDDAFYAIGTTKAGQARQWRLAEAGSGKVAGDLVRTLEVGSTSEGCAADDELGDLYIGEEQGSLWRYAADPTKGDERTAIDAVTAEGGTLEADIEGIEIAYKPDGQGHLVVSSQGSNEYVLYDRAGDHPQVSRFTIADGRVDGTDDTDGLDVVTDPLGAAFPEGLLVVQDGTNDGGNQNFKLVPWNAIVGSAGAASSEDRGEEQAPSSEKTDDEDEPKQKDDENDKKKDDHKDERKEDDEDQKEEEEDDDE